MAVECLGELPEEVDRLVVDAPDGMPYLRSALVENWQSEGREVFLPDASVDGARVSYDVEEAAVTYTRRGRRLARDVRLALHYTLSGADGRVLADERCELSRADLVAPRQLDDLQAEAYPETQADLPEGGWLRRVIEPVVFTAATAVVVYLFFTLRSAGGDGS